MKEKFLVIVVVIAIVVIGLQFKYYENALYKANKSNGQLQPDHKMEVVAEKEQVIVRYLEKEKVITKTVYVPVESHATVAVHKNDTVEIEVKTLGLCVKPNVNILYDQKLQCGVAVRFIYWNRWGLNFGVSQELSPYIMVDRRITDFMPIFDNVSIGVLAGKDLLSASINIYL